MSNYPVIPFDKEKHAEAFFRFIKKVRGDEKLANRMKALEWLHNNHPLRERIPMRFVIMDGERIAGTMGHMPADYMIRGERKPVRITHDLLIDPDYRGKGLAKKIVEHARSTGDFFPGGMWMNVPCYKIHLSCGFVDVLAPRTRTLILDAKSFTQHQGFRFVKRAATKTALDIKRRKALKKASKMIRQEAHGLSINEIREFDPALDDLWIDMIRGYGAAACRDAAFLNWKYTQHPIVPYRLILAERQGKVNGYLVWRLPLDKGSGSRALIVDYLVERGDMHTLQYMIAQVILQAEEMGAESLSIMTTQPLAVKLLKFLGFLASRGEHAWVVANWEQHFSKDWLNNHDQWHICLGDSDGDFWAGSQ